MKNRRIFLIVAVLMVVLALSVTTSLAQGNGNGGNNGGGGGRPPGVGGGKPELTFLTVAGTLAPYGEGLGFVYDSKQYVVDFGPEWYEPNQCLVGLLGGVDSTTILKNGRYSIELTCVAGSSTDCTQASAPSSALNPDSSGDLLLASPRPGAGMQVTVWGMTESKEGYILIRAWEVKYGGGAWTWWRWEGQPWQKAQLLSCDPAGEGE